MKTAMVALASACALFLVTSVASARTEVFDFSSPGVNLTSVVDVSPKGQILDFVSGTLNGSGGLTLTDWFGADGHLPLDGDGVGVMDSDGDQLLAFYVGGGSSGLYFGYQPAGGLLSGGNGTSVTPGVPEPASWAMMLIGVGALGASLRRRRFGEHQHQLAYALQASTQA